MVTVLLRGGLGNQMFEYAAALGLAEKYHTDVVLDTTMIVDRFPRRQLSFRNYDLDVFALVPKITVLSRIANVFPVPGLWVGLDLPLIATRNMLGTQKLIKEKEEHVFDPGVMDAGANAYLWGFWQTPKYFEGAENAVRNAFKFRHPLEGEAEKVAERIKNVNSVALHVRRGDYLSSKYKDLYGGTNLEYYKKAVEYIGARAKDPEFFIFSDDIAWCRENIKTSFKTNYMTDETAGPKASFHMQLMALCKHNIIANSTFSWWAAWLNANPGKIIIASMHWYADPKMKGDGIIPDAWVRI